MTTRASVVVQVVEVSISGWRVTRYLDELAKRRGLPKVIVCDNGPEFTSKALFFWARNTGVKPHSIQPGETRPRMPSSRALTANSGINA